MMREHHSASLATGHACVVPLWLALFLLVAMPVAATAEFQVNTYTTYKQFVPAVAMDQTGSFVVVWEAYDQDGSGNGVFAQRYDSTATAVGGEFQVNTYTRRGQGNPSVAADENGSFVVVWSGEGEDDYSGVFGQRYDSAGDPLGSEFQVNTYTSLYQGGAVVSADGLGGFVIVWQGYGGGSMPGIFGQRYDSTGSPRGVEFQVNTYTSVQQRDPAVAAHGAGGFVVVWSNYGQDDGYYFGVFGQRYDGPGNRAGSEFQVHSSTIYYPFLDEGFSPAPSVATDAAGGFVVVWNSYDDEYFGVFGRRYDSTGAPKDNDQFQVNTAPMGYGYGYVGSPAVAAEASGGFVVVWENYAGDYGYYGVFGRRYDSSGVPGGDEFQINDVNLSFSDTAYLRDPAIATDGTGNFVVVWDNYGQDGDDYGVFAVAVRCGNGVLDPSEQCDDGNGTPGDGCDAECRRECPDDADPCTEDVYDPDIGRCYPSGPDGTACDDGDLCTRRDECRNGACQSGPRLVCPGDGSPCTEDICNPETGRCYPPSPDDTPCSNGTGCEAATGDVCQAGVCVDAAICSAVEIIEEQKVGSKNPRFSITCRGETRKDSCKVQGFTTAADSTMEVAVTKKVRKRIKRWTGKATIKLKLNRVGRRLLRQAFDRGEPFDVRVQVESRQAGKTSSLDYPLRLVSKNR